MSLRIYDKFIATQHAKIKQKGYLLIDVLLGVFITGFALTAIALAYTQAFKAMAVNKSSADALSIAQQNMEMLRRNDGVLLSETLPFPLLEQAVALDNKIYQVTVKDIAVEAVQEHADVLRPCQVTVSWQDGNVEKELKMVEYFYLRTH